MSERLAVGSDAWSTALTVAQCIYRRQGLDTPTFGRSSSSWLLFSASDVHAWHQTMIVGGLCTHRLLFVGRHTLQAGLTRAGSSESLTSANSAPHLLDICIPFIANAHLDNIDAN